MSFLHITNQSETSADINLFSTIENGSGQSFVNELNFLDSLGLENINIRINSTGGNVFEGFGIVSAMRNAKTQITTINEGIAASTAGWVLASGNKRKAVDFSKTMTHNPSIGGDKSANSEQKNMLNSIKESLITIFTNNTGLSSDEIDDMMNKTTFMSAKEALRNGIIDEIISTKRKIKNSISPDDLLNLVNNNFQEKPKTEKMELITNHLNLNVDSNESAVLNAIKENESLSKEILETEENAHKETKETLAAVQNELTELKSVAIAQTVENAIEAGKIKAEDKEKMLKIATETPEAFNSILESIQPARQKLVDTIENNIEDENTRKDWTIRDFEKKDPKALVEMIKNDYDGYSELFEATYKVKPSK